jgi:hypothetical protein
MMDEDDAVDAHRLAQVRKLLDAFEGAHGRPARTGQELNEWAASPEGKSAMAYDRTPDGNIIP